MKLVRGAAGAALTQGLERIDLALLEETYEQHLIDDENINERGQQTTNPFYLEATARKPPESKKVARRAARQGIGGKATSKRIRATKQEASLSAILRRQ
jgi:hypothetical protein